MAWRSVPPSGLPPYDCRFRSPSRVEVRASATPSSTPQQPASPPAHRHRKLMQQPLVLVQRHSRPRCDVGWRPLSDLPSTLTRSEVRFQPVRPAHAGHLDTSVSLHRAPLMSRYVSFDAELGLTPSTPTRVNVSTFSSDPVVFILMMANPAMQLYLTGEPIRRCTKATCHDIRGVPCLEICASDARGRFRSEWLRSVVQFAVSLRGVVMSVIR